MSIMLRCICLIIGHQRRGWFLANSGIYLCSRCGSPVSMYSTGRARRCR